MELAGGEGDMNPQRQPLIATTSRMNESCVRDSPTIEQRKQELQSNGLFGGYVFSVAGNPSGVTSVQSTPAAPIAVKKSHVANRKI